MEVIKRKILLENSIDRGNNSPTYGTITATSFYLNVMITQTFDDMGLFTDMSYIPNDNPNSKPDYTVLIEKLAISGLTFPFMLGVTPVFPSIGGIDALMVRPVWSTTQSYFNFGNIRITGTTDSKLNSVRSYNTLNPYQAGFNISTEKYVGYTGNIIDGVNRITLVGEPTAYAFDAIADINIGTNYQTTGLLYNDYTKLSKLVTINGNSTIIPLTIFSFMGEGWNQTNVTLSALVKEEYLFGVTEKPVIQSDVFIDRGAVTVMEKHLVLSEINNLDELIQYNNGAFNITNQ